jgi:hypothetical protein
MRRGKMDGHGDGRASDDRRGAHAGGRIAVTVRTFEPSQVRQLQEHFDAASAFHPTVLDQLRALAVQIGGCSVLPLIGAGGSYDCGMPLARQIGEDLLRDYLADPRFAPHAAGLSADLGDVAEAI